ncbi:somatomedin-B and thrombospondin type-1 domain-containing protein-like [Acipenser oxyrinchus oxyrinchus]|uniref:Somatomedin-B and thrombospondin type-1 domain-containing protein-like n=1 Tax=Acipenser oxyrinchus oxyrinchus TaxID=40147 RepID=A0AAD8GGK4_ACIOX|nr:somatomedin-B and thrombospondin type-1 domain-containing protein-like [Acipenser oxyrinchus oxyrinchus]
MSGLDAKGGCLVLLAALLWLSSLAEGGCSAKCCKGRDPTCSSTDWRMDRVFGTCFCDGTCKLIGDCCYDYTQECPAQSCTVSEWSTWSGCALQCKPTYRVRIRSIEREPMNGGDPCPALEEKAGCLEYINYQGQYCAHTHGPAFITTLEYNKERRKRDLSIESDAAGYCMEFKLESLSQQCTTETRPYARWMQYLREGYTVCVICQPPAMNRDSHSCQGDGTDFDRNKILHWQAVGNSRCRGTWKKVQRVEQCSCPVVHSFVFT